MNQAVPKGNMILGLLAGFFLGCIGLVLVMIIAKGQDTKRGAVIGFVTQVVVGAIIRLAAS